MIEHIRKSFIKKIFSRVNFSVSVMVLSSLLIASVTPVLAQFSSDDKEVFISEEISTENPFTSISATWNSDSLDSHDYQLNVRFKQNDSWTRWYHIEPSIDFKKPGSDKVESFFATNKSTAYQYMITDFDSKKDIQSIINSIDFQPIHEKPVATRSRKLFNLVASLNTDITPEPGLNIIKRSEWGANENLRIYTPDPDGKDPEPIELSDSYKKFLEEHAEELKLEREIEYTDSGEPLIWPLEYPQKIRKIFVHHTASTNNLDNPEQAIRDIYQWHASGRGWGDVGYNYIIDPQGNIYEGRYGGEKVIGAHVGRANNGSIGIAVLGNYEDAEISKSAEKSLTKLIAAKAKRYDLDPTGTSLFRGEYTDTVLGHRDYGATSCPGEKLYAKLPEIREQAANSINGISDEPAQIESKSYSYQVVSTPDKTINTELGEKFSFTIKLRNTGISIWRQGGPKRVAILDRQKVTIGFLQEYEVEPGEIGTFRVTAKAPNTAGEQNFKIRPVVGEDQYFDNTYIAIAINVFADPYKGKITGISNDRIFKPGETRNIWIQMINTGGKSWVGNGPTGFQLTSLVPQDVNIIRTQLFEKEVAPGEVGTIVITMKGPDKEGDYTMYFYPWVNGHKINEERIHLPIKVSNDPNAQIADPFNPVREDPKPTPAQSKVITHSVDSASTATDQSNSIRIALSYRGNPVITGNGPFDIYSGSTSIASFQEGDKVTVTHSNDEYKISSDSIDLKTASPPRFVPGLQTILEIDNFENHPAWNPDLNDNTYRGILEVREDDDELIVINELPLESYLRGIAEVSNTAHEEKIKALIVAARSYAVYYMTLDQKFPGKPYHLDDSPESSQKYLGFGLETRSPNIVSAIRETSSEVIKYDGEVVKAPYFNQSNGNTLSAEEVWGWTHTPYLQSVPDTYCSADKQLGHGVGMSGCGATGMAEAGKNYEEILKYFYQGITIGKH